jgi:hypothetical protein
MLPLASARTPYERQNAKLEQEIAEWNDIMGRVDALKAAEVSKRLHELEKLNANVQDCLDELWRDDKVRRLMPQVQGQRTPDPASLGSSSASKRNKQLRHCMELTEAR